MLTFSLNTESKEILDSFITVYDEHVDKYNANTANDILINDLYAKGYAGSHDLGEREIINTRFDTLQQSRYVTNLGCDISDAYLTHDMQSLTPIVDQYEELLDSMMLGVLEDLLIFKDNGLIDDTVTLEIMVQEGVNILKCFKKPELFNRQHSGKSSVELLLQYLEARGVELEDINKEKFFSHIHALMNDNTIWG